MNMLFRYQKYIFFINISSEFNCSCGHLMAVFTVGLGAVKLGLISLKLFRNSRNWALVTLRLVRHGQRKCSLGKEKCAKYFLVEKYFVEKYLGNKNLVQKTMLVVLFPLLCLTLGAPASVLNKQGGVLL